MNENCIIPSRIIQNLEIIIVKKKEIYSSVETGKINRLATVKTYLKLNIKRKELNC